MMNILSTIMAKPSVKNILIANKAVRKVQSSNVQVTFPRLGRVDRIKILTYSDATHVSLPSGASSGALLMIKFYQICVK